MNGLFRFIAKLFGRGRSSTPETPPPAPLRLVETSALSAEAPATKALASEASVLDAPPPSPPRSPPTFEPNVILLDLAEDEDVVDESDDEIDEPDPTVGRYEELHVEILDAEKIGAQRTAAEAQALLGPHKIFPHDPAGPGSLAETLARLEADGRVTSRVCDDAESGFYVLYEPASRA
jgi:hypothetical protein